MRLYYLCNDPPLIPRVFDCLIRRGITEREIHVFTRDRAGVYHLCPRAVEAALRRSAGSRRAGRRQWGLLTGIAIGVVFSALLVDMWPMLQRAPWFAFLVVVGACAAIGSRVFEHAARSHRQSGAASATVARAEFVVMVDVTPARRQGVIDELRTACDLKPQADTGANLLSPYANQRQTKLI